MAYGCGRVTQAKRSTRIGYLLAATAAVMWGLNGSLAKFLLNDGVDAYRLTQLRTTVAWLLLAAGLLLFRRDLIRVERRDVPRLALLGIGGLALVQLFYFAAIARIYIGVALLLQYLGPLMIAVWLTVAHGRRLPRPLWGAIGVTLAGSFLVVRAYDPQALELDAVGILAGLGAAVTFAFYIVQSERAGARYNPLTTLFWGFGFGVAFWAVVTPWWKFPFDQFRSLENILLGLGVATIGTLFPFLLMVTAVQHIPASRAALVAFVEPVSAAAIAWFVHDQVLSAPQLVGGGLVIAALFWVQAHRPDLEAERAPHGALGAGHPSRAAAPPQRAPARSDT